MDKKEQFQVLLNKVETLSVDDVQKAQITKFLRRIFYAPNHILSSADITFEMVSHIGLQGENWYSLKEYILHTFIPFLIQQGFIMSYYGNSNRIQGWILNLDNMTETAILIREEQLFKSKILRRVRNLELIWIILVVLLMIYQIIYLILKLCLLG